MRHWPRVFLAVAVGYLALHALAGVLGIPPSLFFSALFQAAGFAFGCVALLLVAYQLTRR